MRKLFLNILFVLILFDGLAQPALVNTGAYGKVSQLAFDTLTDKIYVNYLHGCPTWNIPCAYSFSLFSQHNLVNKHNFSDNTLSSVQASNYQVSAPAYPVNNFNSAIARNCRIHKGAFYTNFGYFFNKRDTNFVVTTPIWTYSPAANPSYKEISSFEIKGDSVLFFEKDSTSGNNYYTVFLRHAINGASIPYYSLDAGIPFSMLGSINGQIRKSIRVNDRVLLVGAFTASVLGTFVGRNIISFNINTGSLESVPLTLPPGSDIFDIELYRDKIWLCGRFQTINGLVRKNFAVLNTNFTLSQETLAFEGSGNPSGIFVDAIEWYHDFLIVKGNFNAINGEQLNFTNNYWVRVFNSKDSLTMPWTFSLPGTPLVSDYMFQMFRHKLYIKNRNNSGSPFHIYCFEPIRLYPDILIESTPSPSIVLCSPGTLSCSAPFKYAANYYWSYSGTGLSIQNQSGGANVVINAGQGASSGTLSVVAYNDCGLASDTAKMFIKISPKPNLILSNSNPVLLCDPDSTLLSAATSNTNAAISWRKAGNNNYFSNPFYTKYSGNYFAVAKDLFYGCADSTSLEVSENKRLPNAKLLSHVYPGITIPIDTSTCFKPQVNIMGGSDTGAVFIKWRALSGDSVYYNPLSVSSAGYYKLIVKRADNACADSSIIVLTAENKQKPSVNIPSPSQTLNCSNYSLTLHALHSPSNCTAEWVHNSGFIGTNTITVTSPGNYLVKITNPANGCMRKDSVNVNSSSDFEFVSSADTLVCKNSLFTLYSAATGSMTNVTYSWNGISGTSSLSIQPQQTTLYIISAVSGTCAGTDSILVKVPEPLKDSVATFRSCSNPGSGALAVFASGGRAPYEYSIDGGQNFHSTGLFMNSAFGLYSVAIRDSMMCTAQATAELNAFSNLPQPRWLASTFNVKQDTLVLVDVSVPKPDSVQWFFPSQIYKIGGDMFNPVITGSDTGEMKVTMKAFYGDCIITSEKWIRFGEFDSLRANKYNNHGILSFILFPNPSSGIFNVEVQFAKKQNAVIQVWNNSANKHFQSNFYNVSAITEQFNLQQLQNGTYFLKVIGEFDAGTKPFIINK